MCKFCKKKKKRVIKFQMYRDDLKVVVDDVKR